MVEDAMRALREATTKVHDRALADYLATVHRAGLIPARRRAFRGKQRAMRARRLVASGIRRRLSRAGQVL